MYIGWDGREYEDAELEQQRSKEVIDDKSILVREENGRIVTEHEDGDGELYLRSGWWGTKEQLHTSLAKRGYKRAGKQEGSDIGGVYVK